MNADALRGRIVGRTIASLETVNGYQASITLDDGTVVHIGGGEDKHGGYGFLTTEEGDL